MSMPKFGKVYLMFIGSCLALTGMVIIVTHKDVDSKLRGLGVNVCGFLFNYTLGRELGRERKERRDYEDDIH